MIIVICECRTTTLIIIIATTIIEQREPVAGNLLGGHRRVCSEGAKVGGNVAKIISI